MKKRCWWYFWGANYRDKGTVKLKFHWQGQVYIVNEVICLGDCWSKARKKNPVLVMETTHVEKVEFTITKGYQDCLKYKTAIIYVGASNRTYVGRGYRTRVL